MSNPVSTIRNLGPAMQRECARAGIHTADALRDLGTDETYRRLLAAGSRPHFIAYYVIEMGLQGRPWNDCRGPEKDALRKRFDLVVAQAQAQSQAQAHDPHQSALEKVLNEIGVLRSS
jgi:hypothetical protein